MVKRKATAILESLKEEPVVQEPTPPPSEPSMTLPSEPSLTLPPTLPPPPVEEPPKPVKRVEKRKLNEDSDLMKFQKKLEEREARLEMRLENMIQRKFMEVKDLAKPVMNYKPKQPPPVQRIQPRAEPRYEPRHVPQYDEYEGYATQEEYEDEEEVVPAVPEKSALYNKIFGC